MNAFVIKQSKSKGCVGHGDRSLPTTFGNRRGPTWHRGKERALKYISEEINILKFQIWDEYKRKTELFCVF